MDYEVEIDSEIFIERNWDNEPTAEWSGSMPLEAYKPEPPPTPGAIHLAWALRHKIRARVADVVNGRLLNHRDSVAFIKAMGEAFAGLEMLVNLDRAASEVGP